MAESVAPSYFDPVFEELNRRKSVVYVHPIAAPCCSGLLPYLMDAAIEFGSDTTRAIANFVYLGAAQRFPDVTMIWSHAGGTMPFLIERFDRYEKNASKARA
jgi:6-methylsalicylate decarboxylase